MMNCYQAHGWKEHDDHVLIYKTRVCKSGHNCAYKDYDCPFYHDDKDKRTKQDIQNDLQFLEEDIEEDNYYY